MVESKHGTSPEEDAIATASYAHARKLKVILLSGDHWGSVWSSNVETEPFK